MLQELALLLVRWRPHFSSKAVWVRACSLLLSLLVTTARRHTITSSLRTAGRDQLPHAADYFVFSRANWEERALFDSVTDVAVETSVIREILAAGREMLTEPVEPLPGVDHALAQLSERYRLVLITKGDLLHQEQKLAASGLGDLFAAVEIVSEKDADTYRRVFARHGTGPGQAVMAGNSVRSDVIPALEAGCWGALIPYPLVWAHEAASAPADHSRYVELASISDLPAWVDGLS